MKNQKSDAIYKKIHELGKAKKYEEALRCFDEFPQPLKGSDIYDKAEVLFGLQRYQEAGELFDQYIAHEDKYIATMNQKDFDFYQYTFASLYDYAWYYRACVFAFFGEEEKAMTYLERALELGATVWQVMLGKNEGDGNLNNFKTGHLWNKYRKTERFRRIIGKS